MNNMESFPYTGIYSIGDAQFCTVGKEWNHNSWDPKLNPAGYHGLYYRTDHFGSHAVLHTMDGPVPLHPDRIYFVPAYSVLSSQIDGQMEKYYIHFQADHIDYGLYRHLYTNCSVPADSLTRLLFDTVVQHYKDSRPVAQRKVRGAMELLLSDLQEQFSVPSRNLDKFRPVLEWIQDHYREKIAVSELADMMNVSTVYFSNAFKTAFCISPKQYILGKRLFESQRLLTRTDLSVKEIAEQVGFENENYFSEFFSARVGIPALKFRSGARGK